MAVTADEVELLADDIVNAVVAATLTVCVVAAVFVAVYTKLVTPDIVAVAVDVKSAEKVEEEVIRLTFCTPVTVELPGNPVDVPEMFNVFVPAPPVMESNDPKLSAVVDASKTLLPDPPT